MRIVSFVPEATEVVFALGLGEHLVGVSYHCDYPPQAREKPVVVYPALADLPLDSGAIHRAVQGRVASGQPLYHIDLPKLRRLAPDLVLAQGLCEVCACPARMVAEAVASLPRRPRVLSLNPTTLDEVLEDITRVGQATGAEGIATAVSRALRERVDRVERLSRRLRHRPTVVALEWLEPLMVAGHWLPQMVELAGGVPLISRTAEPSFRVEWRELQEADPDVLLLVPCGLTLEEALRELPRLSRLEGWADLRAVREGRVLVGDASAFFSRPGPRLVDGLEALARALHPGLPGGPIRGKGLPHLQWVAL